MGNLRSVSQAVMHVADRPHVTWSSPNDPKRCAPPSAWCCPARAPCADCMRELRDSGLLDAVLEAAASKPLMGVCVGMQMLLDHSEEQDTPGLGLIPGGCCASDWTGRLQPDGSRYKVPQMGWNQVRQAHEGMAAPASHGAGRARRQLVLLRAQLLCRPSDARHSAGRNRLRRRFTCAVARDNIFATQFHPEKSADQGLALYRNFLHWKP
jgi:glutamine amidotransferase